MRIPRPARQYERTCDNCGHAWRVPRWAAHRHVWGLPMGASPETMGGEMERLPRKLPDAVFANAEVADRAGAYRRCPECDSDRNRQRPIRS
jgi:hypothetical protein